MDADEPSDHDDASSSDEIESKKAVLIDSPRNLGKFLAKVRQELNKIGPKTKCPPIKGS